MQTEFYANWEYSHKSTTLSGNFPCLISKEPPCFLPLSHFLTTPPKTAPIQTRYPGKRPMVRTDLKQVTFHISKKKGVALEISVIPLWPAD